MSKTESNHEKKTNNMILENFYIIAHPGCHLIWLDVVDHVMMELSVLQMSLYFYLLLLQGEAVEIDNHVLNH